MVREKDICWEYAEKLDGNKVKCKFCLRILNGGISRLKHHLSRLPSKGVNPCSKVRDDVTDKVLAILAASKDDNKLVPSTKKRKREELPLVSKMFPNIATTQGIIMPCDQENAERSIALFFFENKLDFSVARSSSYHLMIDSIAKCGKGFNEPTPESLKTKWLEIIKSEVNMQHKEIEKEWLTTGCTIIVETWTDNKSRALINFLMSSPSSMFFHKSVDASSYLKNPKYLADLFDGVIQDFGPENIVQIILDNTLNCTSIVNHILQTYGTIYVSPCASQCLNAILKEFSEIEWVNRCILQAQIVSKFIYNNSSLVDMMKKFTVGEELIKTGITKYVSHFLSLQSILKQRSRLKHMLNSPEFSNNPCYSSKPVSMTCIGIIDDNEFWRGVEECVAVSDPFLKVMREVSGGKPAVGSIYELMTKAKESIRTYYIMDDIKCKIFFDIVDQKWQSHLHSPLHSAAAFLNPSIQYNPEIKFLGSIKEDFFRVLEKLLPTPELRRDITNQILLFTRATGMFGCNLAKEAIDAVSPACTCLYYMLGRCTKHKLIVHGAEQKGELSKSRRNLTWGRTKLCQRKSHSSGQLLSCITWVVYITKDVHFQGMWWEQYGDSAPTLQRVAMRILSQVCSASSSALPLALQQQHWSTFQQIHSDERNKISKETLSDMAYIHYNLKLAAAAAATPKPQDPIQLQDIDMTSQWVEDDNNPTQWLDRFGDDLTTRQFTNSIFGPNDHLFNL